MDGVQFGASPPRERGQVYLARPDPPEVDGTSADAQGMALAAIDRRVARPPSARRPVVISRFPRRWAIAALAGALTAACVDLPSTGSPIDAPVGAAPASTLSFVCHAHVAHGIVRCAPV